MDRPLFPSRTVQQDPSSPFSPHFSHLLVTKRRKGRPDKARDRGPRKRTVRYVEEADGGGTRLRVAQSGRIIAPMQ